MLIAITRGVSPAIARCELTHVRRTAIDVELACAQLEAYEAALASCGATIHRLATEPDLPDAVFVEDTAVVLDECAIITRPGAASRRPETVAVAKALTPYRKLLQIEPPGTLDGGDVLHVAGRMFVGRSTRTNQSGIEQLRELVARYGITLETVDISGCLHLQSAATPVARDALLVNPAWVDRAALAGLKTIDIDPAEADAANALYLADAAHGDTVLYQPQFPRTLKRLQQAGLHVVLVDMSELGKAEGALTCCALVFRA